MQYPPFERLPRVFVPRKSMAIKPPVFHYGWPVVWQKLLAFAEAHALTGTFFSVMIKLPPGAHDPGIVASSVSGEPRTLSRCRGETETTRAGGQFLGTRLCRDL